MSTRRYSLVRAYENYPVMMIITTVLFSGVFIFFGLFIFWNLRMWSAIL